MESKLMLLAVVLFAATAAEGAGSIDRNEYHADNQGKYFRITAELNFDEAVRACQRAGAHLAYINNRQDNNEVLGVLQHVGTNRPYWIGLSDAKQEGSWRWLNEHHMEYSNWAPGEPNNFWNEDCAVVNYNHLRQWNDQKCEHKARGAICQRIPGHAASSGGVSFFRIQQAMNYHEAIDACKAKGAELAIIRNSFQNALAIRAIEGVPRGQLFYLGGNDREVEGTWKWNDGTPMAFRYFAPGEPNNFWDQDCVAMNWGVDGRWDDRKCTDRLAGALCMRSAPVVAEPAPAVVENTVVVAQPVETTHVHHYVVTERVLVHDKPVVVEE